MIQTKYFEESRLKIGCQTNVSFARALNRDDWVTILEETKKKRIARM